MLDESGRDGPQTLHLPILLGMFGVISCWDYVRVKCQLMYAVFCVYHECEVSCMRVRCTTLQNIVRMILYTTSWHDVRVNGVIPYEYYSRVSLCALAVQAVYAFLQVAFPDFGGWNLVGTLIEINWPQTNVHRHQLGWVFSEFEISNSRVSTVLHPLMIGIPAICIDGHLNVFM